MPPLTSTAHVEMYAANGLQWHLQSLRDVVWHTKEEQWVRIGSARGLPATPDKDDKCMPAHFDGGRAFLVWAIGLWTRRIVRVWDAEEAMHEITTFSGHSYFAGFMGLSVLPHAIKRKSSSVRFLAPSWFGNRHMRWCFPT